MSLSTLSNATIELWKSYRAKTPNSLLIIDAFLVFLIYVGAVQFVYACLTGGYPFNSFLAGFAAAVGQFVLAGIPLPPGTFLSGLLISVACVQRV